MGICDGYIPEKDVNGEKQMSASQTRITLEQMEKSICKIKCNEKVGTGFFLNIINVNDWNSLSIKAIITNNHILEEEDILPGKTINLSINDGPNKFILIDESRKTYTSQKYDISIIEMKQIDSINMNSFLDVDNRVWKKELKEIFSGKSIYLLHYPKGIEATISRGKIKDIKEENNYIIEHYCNSDFGSSGGPLISLDSFKVIGIHKGASEIGNWNLGTLIKKPIEEFLNKYKIQKDNRDNIYRTIIDDERTDRNIDNIIQKKCILETLGGEEDKNIGFDINLLKIDALFVNLILI